MFRAHRLQVLWTGLATLAAIASGAPYGFAQSTPQQSLQIYVVDAEGGNAVLFVAPSGESVLIDTGNPGGRDADRIMAAAHDAGIRQIDHLITTHWHVDHFGGMEELSKRLPIKEFIDHGPNEQAAPDQLSKDFSRTTYAALYAKEAHKVVKPGDRIAVAGLEWRIVTANAEALRSSLPGGGKLNPACAGVAPKEPEGTFGSSHDPKMNATENGRSVGSIIAFGKFRVAMLGDLTWNKELELMCPNNPIGTVDLMISSHHGLNVSNSPPLVHGLRPRVYIMNNGIRKGGQPETMRTVFSSPGLEDLWQIHFSEVSGQEYTAPGVFIANELDTQPTALPIAGIIPPVAVPGQPPVPPPPHNGTAYWIKVSAQSDGTFTVLNGRNSFGKTYRQK